MRPWKWLGCAAVGTGLIFGFLTPAARAGTVLRSEVGPGGHVYEVVRDADVSWSGAKAAAEAGGGFLVTIGDAAEQSFIEGLLTDAAAPSGSYWFGLRETATEGDFRHLSGRSPTYNNFLAGQPDNNTSSVATGENSGGILWSNPGDPTFDRRGKWNDLPDVNPTVGSVFPDLNRGGYLVEFKGTGAGFDNGDGDNLLPGGTGRPNPIPLPAALWLFPVGAVVAAYAGKRLRFR